MEKRQKIAVIVSTLGVFLILLGTTFAFFNYTRTGVSNTVTVGRISFNSNQTNTITLLDAFPIDKNDVNTSNQVGTATINITGDTDYDNGIEYVLTVSNLTNTVSDKQLPIDVLVTGSGLGTSDENYFTNHGGNSSIYKVMANGTIANNQKLLVGYITKGSTGVNGQVTIKAYIDKDKIAITDTYDDPAASSSPSASPSPSTTPTATPGYTNGTTSEWVNGRTVLTTDEWNYLRVNGVSFQVKVEANEGTWVQQ